MERRRKFVALIQQPPERAFARKLNKVEILQLHRDNASMYHLVSSPAEISERAASSYRRECNEHAEPSSSPLRFPAVVFRHRDGLGELPQSEKTAVVLTGVHRLRVQPETVGHDTERRATRRLPGKWDRVFLKTVHHLLSDPHVTAQTATRVIVQLEWHELEGYAVAARQHPRWVQSY